MEEEKSKKKNNKKRADCMKGKRRKEFRVSAGEESACESIAWKAESYSSI